MTRSEARAAVQTELERLFAGWSRSPSDLIIIDDLTRELPWGWVFFYNSRRFIETGDPLEAFGGNTPFLVNRSTGQIRVTGTARSTEHYIREYEASLT